jgi:hypothetical protein
MNANGCNSAFHPSTTDVREACEQARFSAGIAGETENLPVPISLTEAPCLHGPLASHPVPGCTVGTLVGFSDTGVPMVQHTYDHASGVFEARQTIALHQSDVGAELVLISDSGSPTRPIIVGRLRPPAPAGIPQEEKSVAVTIDGQQLVLSAEQEIVLRCGKASITLTRAGKVLIRGAYLLSRSSGVNRIKGGSVQIN